MLNFKIFRVHNLSIKRSKVVQYLLPLYYVEIIYVISLVNFLFGKTTATLIGGTITLLFTIHIAKIITESKFNITIQLLIMDIYIPYCMVFVINSIISDLPKMKTDYFIIAFRSLMCIAGIFSFFVLTESSQKN
ncbi:MAG: hypothetical protein KBG49_05015 [Spirochaetes bacterium]|jgi:hypothetical protein|nr:hypothetical protein [Spirochaetota bacterium]HPX90868.1 hypothetical protein [Spirochaetota bacterium]